MRHGVRSFIVLLIAVGHVAGQGHARPPLTLSVSMQARSLKPGEVILVAVTASRDVDTLDGTAFGNPIEFWRATSPRRWLALIGIPLDTEIGRREIVVHGTTADAVSESTRVSLQILEGGFEQRRLRVDQRFVDPPLSEIDRVLAEQKRLDTLFATTRRERFWSGAWRSPVPGRPTSSFGRQTVMNGEVRGRHQGADFHASTGTPVHAPNAGEIVLAEGLYFSGNTVVIDHGDGLYSLFAHLSRIDVRPGARVASGDVLGLVGATGRVTGPHLHWAVRLHDVSVDPLSLAFAAAHVDDQSAAPSSAAHRSRRR
jgi:murein DD-endopeptidase MepM/ murein hydrolase activator NlpD